MTKMSEILASLFRVLLLLAVTYTITAVLAHYWSLKLMFPRPAATYALGGEYFHLTAPDGVKLAARHWPNPTARHTVLWFPGNGEDLGSLDGYMPEWQKRGFAVFAVDYRGYGHSEGTPTEAATYRDAAFAVEWLKREKGLPASQIVLMGYSLGSGPAVELATREKFAGMILVAPMMSAYRVMTVVPVLPGDKFRNLAKIGRIKCPVLILHGTDDRIVPIRHGEKLFAAAPEPKRRLWVQGAGHEDVSDVAGDAYWQAIRKFTESL